MSLIEGKICRICKKFKSFNEFHIRIESRDGHRNECKECHSLMCKERKGKNLEIYKERDRRYREFNKEKIKTSKKEDYLKNKERIKLERKEYVERNKEKVKEVNRKNYIKNKEKRREYFKKYNQENKEKLKETQKLYRDKRREELNAKRRLWHQKRIENPSEKLKLNLKRLFLVKLKKKNLEKTEAMFSYTGIKIQEYFLHLSQDPLWLQYKTKGDVHIDHIIPCSAYDFTNPEEIKKCWNPRNLRLLSAKENILKSNIIDFELIEKYKIEDLLPKIDF